MCMSCNSACPHWPSGCKKGSPLCPRSTTHMTPTWNVNLWSILTWNHIKKRLLGFVVSASLNWYYTKPSNYLFLYYYQKTEKECNLIKVTEQISRIRLARPRPILFYFYFPSLLVNTKILRAWPSECSLDLQTEGSNGSNSIIYLLRVCWVPGILPLGRK